MRSGFILLLVFSGVALAIPTENTTHQPTDVVAEEKPPLEERIEKALSDPEADINLLTELLHESGYKKQRTDLSEEEKKQNDENYEKLIEKLKSLAQSRIDAGIKSSAIALGQKQNWDFSPVSESPRAEQPQATPVATPTPTATPSPSVTQTKPNESLTQTQGPSINFSVPAPILRKNTSPSTQSPPATVVTQTTTSSSSTTSVAATSPPVPVTNFSDDVFRLSPPLPEPIPQPAPPLAGLNEIEFFPGYPAQPPKEDPPALRATLPEVDALLTKIETSLRNFDTSFPETPQLSESLPTVSVSGSRPYNAPLEELGEFPYFFAPEETTEKQLPEGQNDTVRKSFSGLSEFKKELAEVPLLPTITVVNAP